MTNEYQMTNAKVYDLEDRTAIFGEAVIGLIRLLPRDDITQIMTRQLVRSATSIGANYMEADGALSKKDFRHCRHLSERGEGITPLVENAYEDRSRARGGISWFIQ